MRIVIHMDCPNSLEAYFQEAGRAGRDGDKAYAVLLYNNNDRAKLEKRIGEEFPDKETIVKIYEHVAYFFQIAAGTAYGHTFLFDIDKFCRTFKHFPTTVHSALKILSRAGYIDYEAEPDSRTRMRFIIERDQLYRLQSMTEEEELLIATVLREYSGLFVDYRFIDESRVAHLTGLSIQQIYLILKSLNHRHIIHYIPPRTSPLITYTRDRMLPEDVVIPKSVYEERKEQFAARIKAMIDYATNDVVCRSRQLLRYFGEDATHDCGQCDVCIDNKNGTECQHDLKLAKQQIMQMLADKQPHSTSELLDIKGDEKMLQDALKYLMLEEIVKTENGMIYIK